MMVEFMVLGAPKGKERPRAAKIRDRTIIYTPKKTRDYEREIALAYQIECSRMRYQKVHHVKEFLTWCLTEKDRQKSQMATTSRKLYAMH